MNNTLLFQHVLENSDYMRAVELTAPSVVKYCRLHGYDYRLIIGSVLPYAGIIGHWEAVSLTGEFLRLGYENVIYLDTDTIIVNMDADMREACVKDKVGAVWEDMGILSAPRSKWSDSKWSHYNAGVLYYKNSDLVQKFVAEWLKNAPGPDGWPWFDNGVLNILGAEWGIINRLDNKWNAGPWAPSDNKVVWGFHGLPDRINSMRLAIAAMDQKG